MRKVFVLVAILPVLAACGGADTSPPEGCRGHGGIQRMGTDATNNKIPFICKDGTVGYLKT